MVASSYIALAALGGSPGWVPFRLVTGEDKVSVRERKGPSLLVALALMWS